MVSKEGKKSIKFSRMNDQDLVIATVRMRVGYVCFVADIASVNTDQKFPTLCYFYPPLSL